MTLFARVNVSRVQFSLYTDILRTCTVVCEPQQGQGTDADAKETGRETDFDVKRKDFVVEVDGT